MCRNTRTPPSDSVGLGQGLRMSVSRKLLGAGDARDLAMAL